MKRSKSSHSSTNALKPLRKQIDQADRAILALLKKRSEIVAKIGKVKFEQGLPVVQKKRSSEILLDRAKRGAGLGLNPRFIKKLFALIQDEAVACQKKSIRAQKKLTKGQKQLKKGKS